MSACFRCHKEIGSATVCPYCQSRQPGVTSAALLRRRLARLVSGISSLLLLVSFFLPWFHPLTWPSFVGANETIQQGLNASISLSGLDLTQQPFFAHEFYSPQTLPGDFVLLWILPIAALLLLSAEMARIWRPGAFGWLRFWAVLAVCASVISLLYLFLKLPELNLLKVQQQFEQNVEYGFWLTCASFILATLLLFRRSKGTEEFSRGRREALVGGLNFLALLGTGIVATGFLLIERQSAARAWSTRAFFRMSNLTSFPRGRVLAWSPDSKALLARMGSAVSTELFGNHELPIDWQEEGGVRFAMLEIGDMTAQAWSPDGRYLAMTAAAQTQVDSWYTGSTEGQPAIWKVFRSYTAAGADKMQLNGLAWSPDGKQLAAGANRIDPGGSALYVWETSSGNQLATYPLPFQLNASVYNVAWSPDGKALAACGIAGSGATTVNGSARGFVAVWNVQSSQVFFQHLSQLSNTVIASLAWSPDNRLLAFADGAFQESYAAQNDLFPPLLSGVPVQTWDVAANRLVRTYSGHILGINCVAWSPDGTRLASGGDDETVQVWDTANGQRLLIYQGTQDEFSERYRDSWVTDLAWSPDGKIMASMSTFEVRIWEAP